MKGYQAATCDHCKKTVSILIRIWAWGQNRWFEADICPKCLVKKANE